MSDAASADALKAAEQSWIGFENDFAKSSTLTAILTAAVLVIALALLVAATVHYQVAAP
ncbi:MAG: hypothetical protein U1F98_12935 [Verrucomicrobiota bacterium]